MEKKEKINKNGVKEYSVKEAKKKIGYVKEFGSWTYKGTKETALCQIKGCSKKAQWLTNIGILCFSHGNDIHPTN